MSDAEERADEIEVLQSIYADEFSWLEEPRKFSILLEPPTEGEEVHVTGSLVVTHPDEYPSTTVPEFEVHMIKGLSTKQTEEMMALAVTTAEEGLGGPTVFSACEALKEWLSDNNLPGQDDSMYAQMMRREQQKDLKTLKDHKKAEISKAADNEGKGESVDPEELERMQKRQQQGTVTPESFAEWKLKFDLESKVKAQFDMDNGIVLDRTQLALLGLDTVTSPSGKELWLRKLAKGTYVGDDENCDDGDMIDAASGAGSSGIDAETAAAEEAIYAQFAARKAAGGGDKDDEEEEEDDEEWLGSEDSSLYDDSEDDYIDTDDDDDDEAEYVPKGKKGHNTVFTGVNNGNKSNTRGAKKR